MRSVFAHPKVYILCALFAANFFIWQAVMAGEHRGVLTIAFLDVGQGDAIFIESPTGNQVLIDGGPGQMVFSPLSAVMPFYDRSIDVVIATHPDADHIGGLPEVLRRYDVDTFLDPGVSSDTGTYQALVQSIGLAGVERVVARRGMKINLGGGATLEILFPDRDMEGADTNDASIVAKLVYGDTSFLFTGDSPEKIERYLASIDGKNLDVDVLKAGHHGSKTSTSDTFLGFTSPQIAVLSVGSDNRYGHPHKEVLDRLLDFDIKILRTDEEGTIVMESDGENIFVND